MGLIEEISERDEKIYRLFKVSREPYAKIAQRFNITVDEVRRIVAPKPRADIRLTHRPPPPEAIEEAIRAYAAPRSLTATVCGDPAKGRSALERKRAEGAA